jgi:tripartite-type tricarboxylate transporter receptor subunit TctC
MHVPVILVVRSDLPVKTVKDLLAYMRADPTRVSFASSGQGQSPHIAAELFRKMAGTETVIAPFRGAAPAANDLIAGNTQAMFDTTATLPFVAQGTLRALAVGRRTDLLPGIPTMAEAGLEGFDITSWYAVMAPAGTPRPIVEHLNASIVKAMALPDTKEKLNAMNSDPVSSTPEAAQDFISGELRNWQTIIARAGIKAE